MSVYTIKREGHLFVVKKDGVRIATRRTHKDAAAFALLAKYREQNSQKAGAK